MVQSLCTGNEDPHRFVPRPSHMVAAHKADVWIRVGMMLEIAYEQAILEGARNPKIARGAIGYFDASTGVYRLEVPTGPVDRSMGDVHPEGNPHYLLDPLNGRIVASRIASYLSQLRPEWKDDFQKAYQDFAYRLDCEMFGEEAVKGVGGARLWTLLLRNQLEEYAGAHGVKLGGWFAILRPYAGQKVVTYHRSWCYLLNRFGLVEAANLEPKPGIPPSPGHLRKILEKVKTEKIRVVLQASYFPLDAANFLRERAGVRVVVAPLFPGGAENVKDYFDVFTNVAQKLVSAFSEEGTEPQR